MKKIVLLFSIVISFYMVSAQSDIVNDISIKAVQPSYNDMSEEARGMLETKLKEIVTTYGIADNNVTDRFVITAKIEVVQKDVTPTTPVKISQKLNITFFIGDVIENKIYSSVALGILGIGENETKSYIQAIQRINASNPQIKSFVENAKSKIINYYTQNCSSILKEASLLENSQEYDAAISKLVAVPKVCSVCYEQSLDAAIKIYDSKINMECQHLLKQAKGAWIVGEDSVSAIKALSYLNSINPQAACSSEAEELWTVINDKLSAQHIEIKQLRDEERIFQREQYLEDKKIEREQYLEDKKFERQQYTDNIKLREQTIRAMEKIGVAWGEHQPHEKVTTIIRGW